MTDDERKAKQNARAAKFRESHPNYAREYQARRRKMIADGTWAYRNAQSSPVEPVSKPNGHSETVSEE